MSSQDQLQNTKSKPKVPTWVKVLGSAGIAVAVATCQPNTNNITTMPEKLSSDKETFELVNDYKTKPNLRDLEIIKTRFDNEILQTQILLEQFATRNRILTEDNFGEIQVKFRETAQTLSAVKDVLKANASGSDQNQQRELRRYLTEQLIKQEYQIMNTMYKIQVEFLTEQRKLTQQTFQEFIKLLESKPLTQKAFSNEEQLKLAEKYLEQLEKVRKYYASVIKSQYYGPKAAEVVNEDWEPFKNESAQNLEFIKSAFAKASSDEDTKQLLWDIRGLEDGIKKDQILTY